MYCGSFGGVSGGAPVERVVNLGHLSMRVRSSGTPILFRGSHSNIRLRIESSSEDNGNIELKNLGLFR